MKPLIILAKAITIFLILSVGNSAYASKINIVTEHLVPFQIVQGNAISGFATEIIEATLQEAKINFELTAHPWSLSYNRALKEQNTCIYSMVRIPEREDKFQWIGLLASSSTAMFSLKDSPIVIENIEQAKNYKIAVTKDDLAHHYLLSKGFEENKHLYVINNNSALLRLLEMPNRGVDLIVSNAVLLNGRLHNNEDIEKYKNVYIFNDVSFEFYFACSLATDKAIVNSLKQAMTRLEKRGVFADIKATWQQSPDSIEH